MKSARVLGVVLVVIGLVAAGPAMAITMDQESTNTSTESDITDESTITSFNASSDNYQWIEASGLTEHAKLEVRDDEDQLVYTNSSADATDATNGHYAWNVTHDEWSDIPIQSGENTTYEFRLINNTTADDPTTLNLTVYIEGVEGRSILYIGSAYTDEDATFADSFDLGTEWELGAFGFETTLPFASQDFSELEEDNVAINGTGSTITVHYANETAQDRLSDVTDGVDSDTWATSVLLSVDGTPVRGYVDEAPSDVDSDDTYAVVDSDANEITYHLGEDYEDVESVDVFASVNRGWVDQFTHYGGAAFGLGGVPLIGFLGGTLSTLTGVLLVVGRPEPEV